MVEKDVVTGTHDSDIQGVFQGRLGNVEADDGVRNVEGWYRA